MKNGHAKWAGYALAALSMACGSNVGDVDRTQPDKVRKDIFTDGKPWYFRQTIIDLPATSSLSFIGEQGDTHKIKWQIDEGFLYAYRSMEQLKGGEEFAQRPGVPYQGTPVAAFRILSHFDIQREYNAQTGEQTNVISENTNDRPWYERQYMRVDWSQNLIADFRFSGSTVKQQPVARYVREGEASKDAAKISDDYVDIVHEMTAEPEVNEWLSAWWGMKVPDCWLYSSIYVDCMGARVKVRSSFLKAPESTYEKMQFDDHKFAKFGYFRSDRFGYDRNYGVVDNAQDLMIERFNLWNLRPGEKCRDDSKTHPWADCGNDKIKPIVYYVNEDYPAVLRRGAERIGADWNDVFKEALAHMTGRGKDTLPDAFIVCLNNPVKDGDRPECGQPGLNPQIGDLRYNFIYYVRNPQQSSPLGYGPHAVDAETGEVISANAFLYGGALETYAQYALDMVKLQNGQLTTTDFYRGDHITKHWAAVSSRREQDGIRLEKEQLQQLSRDLGIKEKAARLRQKLNRGELQGEVTRARLESIRGTALEGEFFNEDMRKMIAPQFDRASDVPVGARRLLSPATIHDPAFLRLEQQREFKLGRATVDMAEFFDDGLAGYAQRMKCNNEASPDYAVFCKGQGQLDEQKAYNWLLEEIYVGVELHEVGHNVGLRHNFGASTDALNYFPKYWELRGGTLRANQKTLDPEFMLTSNAQRANLQAALEGGLREYQYASIMDYGAKPNSDVHGLGLYDRAAVLYGYGEMVHVFDSTGDAAPQIKRTEAGLLAPNVRHYTQLPDLVAANPNYEYSQRVAAMYKRTALPERLALADQSKVEVPYRFCSDEYHDGMSWCYRFDQGADAYEQVRNNGAMYENYFVFNSLRRNRVGFAMNRGNYLSRIYGRYFSFLSAQNKHFLNDELFHRFNDPGCEEGVHFVDPKCGMDRFAAALESLNTLGRAMQTPEPGCYIRHKPGCYVESYEETNGLPATVEKKDASFCQSPPASIGGRLKEVKDTDAYALVEDSTSCEAVRPLLSVGNDQIWEPAVEIPIGQGRFGLDKYNREAFGYSYYWKPVAIGAWWDQWLAMQAMGDPWTDFIGVDAQGDSRSYLINFNSIFRNQVHAAVGAYVNEDFRQYAPYITRVNGDNVLNYQQLVPTASDALSAFGRGPGTVPAGAIILDPGAQYMARLQAMFVGAAYFTQITDDLDFTQAMRIGKAASVTDLQLPDSIRNSDRYVQVMDPVTGHVYYAVKHTPDASWFIAERPFYSMGYEYLKKVRDDFMTPDGMAMRPGKDQGGLRDRIRYIEIMRGLVMRFNQTSGEGFVWDDYF